MWWRSVYGKDAVLSGLVPIHVGDFSTSTPPDVNLIDTNPILSRLRTDYGDIKREHGIPTAATPQQDLSDTIDNGILSHSTLVSLLPSNLHLRSFVLC